MSIFLIENIITYNNLSSSSALSDIFDIKKAKFTNMLPKSEFEKTNPLEIVICKLNL